MRAQQAGVSANASVDDAAFMTFLPVPPARRTVRPALKKTKLNPQELSSIMTILTHIAYSRNIKVELLQSVIAAEFSVSNLAEISESDFQPVMEFLIDLRMDGMRSGR